MRVRRAAGQLPASLGLAAAQIDLIAREERQSILKRASLRAYTDEARRRLDQMAGGVARQYLELGDDLGVPSPVRPVERIARMSAAPWSHVRVGMRLLAYAGFVRRTEAAESIRERPAGSSR